MRENNFGIPDAKSARSYPLTKFLYMPIVDFVARHASGRASILDVGTGTGFLLELIKERVPGSNLVGIDTNMETMQIGSRNIRFIRADASRLPFKRGSFDFIVSRSSFCYWNNHGKILKDFLNALKPGGFVVILDVNRNIVAKYLLILIGMVVLGKSFSDMKDFADRAFSKKEKYSLMKKIHVNKFSYKTLFLGSYYLLIIRKE